MKEEPSLQEFSEATSFTSETYYFYPQTTTGIFTRGFLRYRDLKIPKIEISPVIKFILTKLAEGLLEGTHFGVFYFLYLREKLIDLIDLLKLVKDYIVTKLMWKRGVLFRPIVHASIFSLSVVAIFIGGFFQQNQIAAVDLTRATDSTLTMGTNAETVVPTDRPRSEIIKYKVAAGNTVSQIAEKFQVSPETIKWANNLSDIDSLHPGEVLKIPPVTGVIYTVKGGESLASIAKKYKADAQTIVDFPFNYIDDSLSVKAGQTLVIPGGVIPSPRPVSHTPLASSFSSRPSSAPIYKGGGWMWPVGGGISQYPSWWHPGAVDIMSDVGTPVAAASGGKVISVQRFWYGYGWHVVIASGSYTSLYAHLSAINVGVGQYVSRGQMVGRVGLTGRSSGPHLHFETRDGGSAINPLRLLP